MGNIKINYKKVNARSSKFKEEADEMYNIKNEMEKIYENLCNEWKDNANVGFKKKFELQIDKIDSFINFYENSSTFLSDITNKHNESEEEFKNSMEKASVFYEYRD